MKFAAVILLACVAVSSAAFTGSLVKHTQPAVDQAMFQLRLASTTKTAALPQIGQIIDHIQSNINAILANIDNVIQNVQQIANTVRPIIENAINAIQNNAGNIVQIVQDAVQQIQAALNIKTRGVISNIQAAIEFVQNLPAFIAQLQQSVADQLSSINFPELLHNAIMRVMPEGVAEIVLQMIGHQHTANKGIIGDLWNSIWGQITDTYNTVTGQISAAINALVSIGSAAVGQIQSMASDYLQSFTNGVSQVTSSVAGDILASIGQMKEELGDLYQSVVDALTQQCFSGAHSSNPNCQVGGESRIRAF